LLALDEGLNELAKIDKRKSGLSSCGILVD
jgi:hypothetical protein